MREGLDVPLFKVSTALIQFFLDELSKKGDHLVKCRGLNNYQYSASRFRININVAVYHIPQIDLKMILIIL